ncbi:MAG: flagellar hook-associated protein FlgK [Candidatus Omnitrophica bacterium]|nr:flagellar hook-associated protein FlgK [Candidatus Omnitrophota bacterium]
MSIAGLDIGTKALQASLVGLEVTGQNISNVNTENYTRQRVRFATDLVIQRPWGPMGTGVTVQGIERIKDEFIEREIRNQTSAFKRSETLFNAYEQLQSIYNEGEGFGLNERIGEFFNSLHDLASFPEDVGMRTAVLGEASTLANQITFINDEIDQMRLDLDVELRTMIGEVNNLLEQIAQYNIDIASIEAGTNAVSSDLRDKRDGALKELAEFMEITVTEMNTGAVNVSTNGRQLVFAGEYNELGTKLKTDDELVLYNVVIKGTADVLNFQSGAMGGILQARDTDIVSYRDNLDALAAGLIQEFNKIHSDGRGLEGYSTLTSANAVNDNAADLDNADLDIIPQDGSFDIIVIDEATGAESTYTITVDLDGAGADDSLTDLAASITAAAGEVTATANADGTLTITMASGYTIQFANDSSEVLAALGINSFFTGSDASDIAVNSDIIDNPSLVAAAQSGNPGDNSNALAMAQLRYSFVMNNGSQTFESFYQSEISRLGSEAKQADIEAQADNAFLEQVVLRRESVSGVNLDEEATNMMRYQASLQAAAKFINVMDDMLNVLVNGLI